MSYHVDVIPNRNSPPPAILFRQAQRDGKRIRLANLFRQAQRDGKRIRLANLSKLPLYLV